MSRPRALFIEHAPTPNYPGGRGELRIGGRTVAYLIGNTRGPWTFRLTIPGASDRYMTRYLPTKATAVRTARKLAMRKLAAR